MPEEQRFFSPGNPLITRFYEGDAGTLGCWVYLPPGNPPPKGWPVVLFLHGAGESATHPSGRKPPESGIGPAIHDHPERFPCIVVMPQCDVSWDAKARDKAVATLNVTLEAVRNDFPHDPDRITLTGLSWGGFGAWQLAAQPPPKSAAQGRFAALMVMCPWPHPGGSAKDAIASVSNLENIPVRVFQGLDDWLREEHRGPGVVPARVRNTEAMVEALRGRRRANVDYYPFEGVGHNCWDRAYGDQKEDHVQWLLAQRRVRSA